MSSLNQYFFPQQNNIIKNDVYYKIDASEWPNLPKKDSFNSTHLDMKDAKSYSVENHTSIVSEIEELKVINRNLVMENQQLNEARNKVNEEAIDLTKKIQILLNENEKLLLCVKRLAQENEELKSKQNRSFSSDERLKIMEKGDQVSNTYINKKNEEIEELAKNFGIISEENVALRDRLNQFIDLQKENEKANQEISQLNSKIREVEQDNIRVFRILTNFKVLENDNAQLIKEINQLNNQVLALKTENEKLNIELGGLKSKHNDVDQQIVWPISQEVSFQDQTNKSKYEQKDLLDDKIESQINTQLVYLIQGLGIRIDNSVRNLGRLNIILEEQKNKNCKALIEDYIQKINKKSNLTKDDKDIVKQFSNDKEISKLKYNVDDDYMSQIQNLSLKLDESIEEIHRLTGIVLEKTEENAKLKAQLEKKRSFEQIQQLSVNDEKIKILYAQNTKENGENSSLRIENLESKIESLIEENQRLQNINSEKAEQINQWENKYIILEELYISVKEATIDFESIIKPHDKIFKTVEKN